MTNKSKKWISGPWRIFEPIRTTAWANQSFPCHLCFLLENSPASTCVVIYTHNHFNMPSRTPLTVAKWQHVPMLVQVKRCVDFSEHLSKLLFACEVFMHFFFVLHPFARFRSFLHAFTVAKLHILQHCLIKCMSCRICERMSTSCPRYSLCRSISDQIVSSARISTNTFRPHCAMCMSHKTDTKAEKCPMHANRIPDCDYVGDVLTKTHFSYGTLFVWWKLLLRHLRRVRRHV